MSKHTDNRDDRAEALLQENKQLKSELEQQNKLEGELRRDLEQYEIIFSSMPIMIWHKDAHNRHLHVNTAAAALEGVAPEAIAGKTAEELYPAEQARVFFEDDQIVMQSGKPRLNILEEHTSPATGHLMYLQTGKIPYRNPAGEIEGVIAFAVDITEQKRAEKELEKAHQALVAKNRLLERAHELFRSSLEQLEDGLARNIDKSNLLNLLKIARQSFTELEKARQDEA